MTTTYVSVPRVQTEWLTVRELAARWRVSPDSIRRMAKAGKLAVLKVGEQKRVHESVVRAFEETGRRIELSKVRRVMRNSRRVVVDVPDYIGNLEA